jgi:hypothetical protein
MRFDEFTREAVMKKKKEYIGYSVYVEATHGMLKVTTEDGSSTTNVVYLEPDVLVHLVRFAKKHGYKI